MAHYNNLSVFFDGTWDDDSSETNVWKLRGDLRLGDYQFHGEEDSYTTEALYETGPGTSADWAIYGGAFAADLGKAIVDAYAWLTEKLLNLKNSGTDTIPQLYVFGFSRGAYRAHAFSWLLNDIGIPMNYGKCREIAEAYVKHDHREALELAQDDTFPSPAIKMLGLWDVVTAPLDKYQDYQDNIRSPLVENLYHAMAANERRKNFPVMQYNPQQNGTTQTWFSGAHSDVGGGYPEDERELSDIAFNWMKHHAMTCGLDFVREPKTYPSFDFSTLREIHDEAFHLTKPRRSFLSGDQIHASLIARRKQTKDYTPEVLNLSSRIARNPTDTTIWGNNSDNI